MYPKLTRAQKAQNILEAGLVHLVHPATGEYIVDSESTQGESYRVNLPARTCECPDFDKRHADCKHLLAAELQATIAKRSELAALRGFEQSSVSSVFSTI